ncbi:MAG: ChbG/HpnK family deacetylase [Solobacterium sp.]|nr:ChbG/HpnK family deacetylase [Solobacterium sp.]
MTKRLLMQSDDYGITDAVSIGILKAIDFGLIKNTGMFVNMPSSAKAAEMLKDKGVCFGIDINYVCGKPVSNPEDVPHLVDEKGNFYSSGTMAKRSKLLRMDALGLISYFEEDPYPYEEIYRETENQVKRFMELTGKKPEYIHPHSLMSENCYRAAHEVAKKYDILHTLDMMHQYRILPGTFDGTKGNTVDAQMEYDVSGNLLENALPTMKEDETCYFICHCGYADYDLFQYTSLTLRRVKDLHAMTDEKVKEYIRRNNIQLITYRDL